MFLSIVLEIVLKLTAVSSRRRIQAFTYQGCFMTVKITFDFEKTFTAITDLAQF